MRAQDPEVTKAAQELAFAKAKSRLRIAATKVALFEKRLNNANQYAAKVERELELARSAMTKARKGWAEIRGEISE